MLYSSNVALVSMVDLMIQCSNHIWTSAQLADFAVTKYFKVSYFKVLRTKELLSHSSGTVTEQNS